jgi:hypothetical protein
MDKYQQMYQQSIGPDSEAFWAEQLKTLDLFAQPTSIRSGDFSTGRDLSS